MVQKIELDEIDGEKNIPLITNPSSAKIILVTEKKNLLSNLDVLTMYFIAK